MNLDITYCSNLKCKNKKCDRNQKHLSELNDEQKALISYHPISIAEFKECDYWR